MPTGSISEAIDIVHVALSKSATLQAEAGEAEAVVKQENIFLYQDSSVDDLSVLKHERPIIVVGYESQRFVPVASGPSMQASGSIAIRIYIDDDPLKKNGNDKYYAACDFIGAVMDELTDELGSGTAVDFGWASIEMVEPIERTQLQSRTKVEDVWSCKYVLDHGLS